MHTGNFLPLALIVLVVLGAAVVLLKSGRKTNLSHISAKPLMTDNELEFFHRLQRALPAYQVFPQVSLGALITVDENVPAKARAGVRNRFDRKIADFVVCERGSQNVVALIELDDKTHKADADQKRDEITKAAGYQTFRFQAKKKPSEAEIAAIFQTATTWNAPKR